MSDIKFTVNVDEYLSLNKYEVDETSAHIELKGGAEACDPAEFDKLIRVCPAARAHRVLLASQTERRVSSRAAA